MAKIVNIKENLGNFGNLYVVESGKEFMNSFCRMFYVTNVPKDGIRGNHANVESNFLMIAMNGNCKVTVDNGTINDSFLLNSRKQGLFIEKMTWKTMYDFSYDCILVVLSDIPYDPSEYVHSYESFLSLVNANKENKS